MADSLFNNTLSVMANLRAERTRKINTTLELVRKKYQLDGLRIAITSKSLLVRVAAAEFARWRFGLGAQLLTKEKNLRGSPFRERRGLEGSFPRNFAAIAVSRFASAAQPAKQSFCERNCASYAENVFLKAAKVKAQIQRQLIFLSQDIYKKTDTA